MASVIVPTTHPWPTVQPCLAAFDAEATALGIEVIVATREAMPAAARKEFPRVKWVHVPDAPTFELRAAGFRAAGGDLLVLTEDHCRARPAWLAPLVKAMDAPGIDLAVGCIDNGSQDRTLDWANFLVSLRPFMPGGKQAPHYGSPPVGSAAFRRSLLPAASPPNWFEQHLAHEVPVTRRAWAPGSVTAHHQSHSFGQTCGYHYHNGRAALRGQKRRIGRVLAGLGGLLVTPVGVAVRTLRELTVRRHMGLAVRSLPFVVLLSACYAVGRLVGAVAGAGHSAEELE